MTRLCPLVAVALMLILTGCEEEKIEQTTDQQESAEASMEIASPQLSALESKIPTVLKFGVEVTSAQVNDTVYHVVVRDDAEALTGEEIINHQDKTELPMAGSYFRSTFETGLQEETPYTVYVVAVKGDNISEVASLSLMTGAAATNNDDD